MELKAGYKNTGVGVIPMDWEVMNLEDTSTLKARIGWQGLTTAEYLNSGSFYLVTGTDFHNGKIKWDTCHFVEKIRYTQDKNIQLKNEDILITKDGTIGKVAYVNNVIIPATLNSGVFVVRAKRNNYVPLFMFYVFNSMYFSKFLNELVAGSTINHLYQKDFVNFNFPLPTTKKEQFAIATVLSDTNNLIQALEKKIAKKQLIKKGAIQKLLSPKEGWEVKTLGEIAEFSKGKGLPKSEILEAGENKCIHYGELFTKYKEDINEIISYTNTTGNCFYSKINDVLMPTSDVTPNGLATASCINENNVILGGDVLVIRIPSQILNGTFLSYFITKNKKQVMQLVTGSTVYHLYGSDMAKFNIQYPNIEEQTHIAQILSDMDNEIETLQKKLVKSKQLKQGLMQNLLTGKIRLI